MDEPFIPAVSNPGRVSFSEDGTRWSCTRDEFVVHRDPETGEEAYWLQMQITRFDNAGDPLPPQIIYTDRPPPTLKEPL